MSYHILATATDAKGCPVPGKIVHGRGHSQIICHAFSMGVEAPRDIATGHGSGKRTHRPFTLVGEWGAAIPRLYGALASNEVLPKMELRFYPNSPKEAAPAYLVQLSNVSVTNILPGTSKHEVSGPRTIHSSANTDTEELTRVKFTFETITITHGTKSKSTNDDWALTG
jgi:type VI secretion system Hcp family effector